MIYLYRQHITTTVECNTNVDCHGASDSCVQNVCHCGLNERYTGRTYTCKMGLCHCGRNSECSETQLCSNGKCQSMSQIFVIINLKTFMYKIFFSNFAKLYQ